MILRGLGSERLAAASYALRLNMLKVMPCANAEESRVVSRLVSSHQLPNIVIVDDWPTTPHITGQGVSTLILARVGAPNKLAIWSP